MRGWVKDKKADRKSGPARIGAAAVLGLTGPEDGNWALLRGIQFVPIAQIAHYRLLGHVMLGALVMAIYHPKVELVWLGLWAVGLAVVHLRGLKLDRELRSEEHTSELQSLMRNSYAV